MLQGLYQVLREKIKTTLTALLGETLTDHIDVTAKALALYIGEDLDFVDCVLIARACILGDDVITFDEKLNTSLGHHVEVAR